MCRFVQINRYMKYTDYTSVNPSWMEHLLKRFGTLCLYLKSLAHKPQQNSLTSECFSAWRFNSRAVQKHFKHSQQTYGFTSSWRRICVLRWPLWVNVFWQMWHVNQLPSLCDFSRCDLSWLSHVKRSERCLHENGLAPVWMWTWRFR